MVLQAGKESGNKTDDEIVANWKDTPVIDEPEEEVLNIYTFEGVDYH
eukprot:SAG11_NODE_15422_length_578_cov_503.288100_2_plen_46_part_01